MEKQQKKLPREEWEQENREIVERLRKQGKLPRLEDVQEAIQPPAKGKGEKS